VGKAAPVVAADDKLAAPWWPGGHQLGLAAVSLALSLGGHSASEFPVGATAPARRRPAATGQASWSERARRQQARWPESWRASESQRLAGHYQFACPMSGATIHNIWERIFQARPKARRPEEEEAAGGGEAEGGGGGGEEREKLRRRWQRGEQQTHKRSPLLSRPMLSFQLERVCLCARARATTIIRESNNSNSNCSNNNNNNKRESSLFLLLLHSFLLFFFFLFVLLLRAGPSGLLQLAPVPSIAMKVNE